MPEFFVREKERERRQSKRALNHIFSSVKEAFKKLLKILLNHARQTDTLINVWKDSS